MQSETNEQSEANTVVSRPMSMLNLDRSFCRAYFRLSKRSRINSAPTDRDKVKQKKPMKKTSTVDRESARVNVDDDDDDDDPLPVCNSFDYTEVTSSSSSQLDGEDCHQNARQSVLHSLMIHLNSTPPIDTSKWDVYRDIGDKFSASISSTVYRSFERIML